MAILLIWIINALSLLIVARVVPGFEITGFYSALIAALMLGLVNAIVRPILLLLTLPITVLTLGLFTFVINALMLWLVASIVKGFDITGFAPAFWSALILWVISFITNWLNNRN